jgi:5-(carboxyamino)imidazole ribonucleotide mutase
MTNASQAPLVGIVMGSRSDWETMQHAAARLEALGVPHEIQVVSRTPHADLLFDYAANGQARGLRAIIAGAGGAAHLPGMLAAKTAVPVLGVPVQSKALNGMDSLLSIVQMPAGIPVATFAIGNAGAANAAPVRSRIAGARAAGHRSGAGRFPQAPDRRRSRQRRSAAMRVCHAACHRSRCPAAAVRQGVRRSAAAVLRPRRATQCGGGCGATRRAVVVRPHRRVIAQSWIDIHSFTLPCAAGAQSTARSYGKRP